MSKQEIQEENEKLFNESEGEYHNEYTFSFYSVFLCACVGHAFVRCDLFQMGEMMNKSVICAVRISPETDRMIALLAIQEDRSKSWIIRQALKSYLDKTMNPRIIETDEGVAIEYGNDDDQNTNVEIEYDPDTDESVITETPV